MPLYVECDWNVRQKLVVPKGKPILSSNMCIQCPVPSTCGNQGDSHIKFISKEEFEEDKKISKR